jgi:hypothetical protein
MQYQIAYTLFDMVRITKKIDGQNAYLAMGSALA